MYNLQEPTNRSHPTPMGGGLEINVELMKVRGWKGEPDYINKPGTDYPSEFSHRKSCLRRIRFE